MRTRVGYTGGQKKNPTYRQLGQHTEAIQIDYDPSQITYAQLLKIFWQAHSPTSKPWSQQYKSAIYFHDEAQKRLALETKKVLEEKTGTLYTDILSMDTFYIAEDYHQKYRLRGLKELAQEFLQMYPDAKHFVNSTAVMRVNAYLAGYGTREMLEKELPLLGLSPRGQKILRTSSPFR